MVSVRTFPRPRRHRSRSAWLPALVLAALVLACGPLFVCAPPWVDNAFFDLCARAVLRGEVLYREIFLHGLPGMVLWQAGVRAVVGWSNEALHLVDLATVALIIWLLGQAVRRRQGALAARLWLAVAALGFYLSTTEWCHCQPDTWMLLPALAALLLRGYRIRTLAVRKSGQGFRLLPSVAEGMCWATACMLKPFVVLPALACWLTAGLLVWRGTHRWRDLMPDAAAVLAGGLIIGGLVVSWMIGSGNWTAFREAAASSWNQEYYATSPGWISRVVKVFYLFGPWGLVHLLAVPVALYVLLRDLTRRRSALVAQLRRGDGVVALLAAVYLGWIIQAAVIQRTLAYHLVGPVFLGLGLLACRPWHALALRMLARRLAWRQAALLVLAVLLVGYAVLYRGWVNQADFVERDEWLSYFLNDFFVRPQWTLPLLILLVLLVGSRRLLRQAERLVRARFARRLVAAAFVIALTLEIPLLQPMRLAVWKDCWSKGSTPEIRDALTLEHDTASTHWVALRKVEEFLTSQQAGDKEVTCYAVSATPLYLDLNLQPSTRFVLLWPALIFFPHHHDDISRALAASRQRFIVSDLRQRGLSAAEANEDYRGRPLGLPPLPPEVLRKWPWKEPIVFRAGRYLVHQATPGGIRAPKRATPD